MPWHQGRAGHDGDSREEIANIIANALHVSNDNGTEAANFAM